MTGPPPIPIKPNPERNGPPSTECKTIRNVLSNVGEDETCVTFNNGKTAIGIRPDLITVDHKQPEKHLKTDDYTTEGFLNLGMKLKRSKARDMNELWLRDKEVLEQLRVYWDNRTNNDANYFTKHHPPIHHHQMRP